MARSFSYSEPDFRQAPYQLKQIGRASRTPRPENAFSFKSPTNYNIASSAGQGIAEAAGLSTLPEAFKTISSYNNYDEQAAGLYASEQAEDRSFLNAAGGIIANGARNRYA